MINVENFITPWSKASTRDFDGWHSMCSYLGAFPPQLANYFINYFTNEGDIVMDPFSGRGTTSLEAKILNRRSLASDLNPIALALCEAKNVNLDKSEILLRINELESKYDRALYQPEALAQDDDIHLIFHPSSLAELIYLKRKLLNSKLQIDKYLLGTCLGILHGGERTDGSSMYASIDMPNTFSMSPDYVRRFVQTKQLNRNYRDIFKLLKDKTERIYKKHTSFDVQGVVLKADVKLLSSYKDLDQFKNQIGLILTSPPYLGIVNYAKQNWIRAWFLDQSLDNIPYKLDDDLNLNEWLVFAKKAVEEMIPFLSDEGIAIFVIGDVAKSKNSIIPLAREFCLMIKENNFFQNVWCFSDVIPDFNKTTRIWGETKGLATTTDRIVIMSNINPFEKYSTNKFVEPLDFNAIKKSTLLFVP